MRPLAPVSPISPVAAAAGTVSASTSARLPVASACRGAADSTGLAAAPAAAFAACGAGPAEGSVSKVMMTAPTSTISPAAWWISCTTPAYGDGTSTAALAVSTSTIGWLSVTTSPTCDEPLQDLALGEPLAEVGELELGHPPGLRRRARPAHQYASDRSTACRTRSRSGRYSSSSRDGGYGVSNPVTRSTGASIS